ncbi:MAG: hypothetical protein KAS73_05435 [Candidatus Sabulitectum sp.]|nr:hypothetical protein [Candidatus Sabulitectum sp.]
MIAQSTEFSAPMIISSLTFFLAPGAVEDHVTFDEYYVYLGYCSSNELSATYDDNYVNGWKYPVLERTSPITFLETDPTIYFDTPFFYDPANGNLVFEIAWPNGEDEIYTYTSVTASNTCVYGDYYLSAGDQWTELPHVLINGDLALANTTFAGIKASFQ